MNIDSQVFGKILQSRICPKNVKLVYHPKINHQNTPYNRRNHKKVHNLNIHRKKKAFDKTQCLALMKTLNKIDKGHIQNNLQYHHI